MKKQEVIGISGKNHASLIWSKSKQTRETSRQTSHLYTEFRPSESVLFTWYQHVTVLKCHVCELTAAAATLCMQNSQCLMLANACLTAHSQAAKSKTEWHFSDGCLKLPPKDSPLIINSRMNQKMPSTFLSSLSLKQSVMIMILYPRLPPTPLLA